MVKPGDVPVYVESGAADLGVTGTDVLRETGADVLEPLELGFGFCRLVVASPGGRALSPAARRDHRAGGHQVSPPGAGPLRRRGPAGGHHPGERLGRGGAAAQPVALDRGPGGHGEHARANGLVERETILECGAVLVANRATQKLKLERIWG